MEYMATRKVPGGKLLRVKCDVVNGVLSGVSLTGDFFMHPEDGVSELENALNGMSNEAPVGEYVSKLNDLVHERGFELVGFSVSDVAETLVEAVRGGKDSWGGVSSGKADVGAADNGAVSKNDPTNTSGGLDEMVRSAISSK